MAIRGGVWVVLCVGLACSPPAATQPSAYEVDAQLEVAAPTSDAPRAPLPPAWKPPPPPDALLAELPDASSARREKIIEALASEHGGAALVAALDGVFGDPPDRRWFWLRRVFDAIDHSADPRAADALARFAEKLGAAKAPFDAEGSTRAFARTRAGFALAELGDLRAVPLLVERLGLEPRVAHAAERFWEADAGGHLSRTDNLRVAAARLLSEVFDANKSAPGSTWADADRAVLTWAEGGFSPHMNAMRFLARVKSEKDLRALRKWAFPNDPLPKVGAQPPFPVAFEIAQSALQQLGASGSVEATKLVAQLTRKPKDFDGSMEGMISNGAAMRGMVLRALGVGAGSGLGALGDPSATPALWQIALDPLVNEEVRLQACDSLAAIADEASLRVALTEALARAGKQTPADAFVVECAMSALGRAAHPALAPDMIAALERGVVDQVAVGAARALWPLELAGKAQLRLVALLTRPSVSRQAFSTLLWATNYDLGVLALHRSKLPPTEREALDLVLLDVGSSVGLGPRAPAALARWAARSHAFDEIAGNKRSAEGLRRGFDLLGAAGLGGSTRAGLRRELFALAEKGQPGAVWALAAGSERGSLLALAAGGPKLPVVTIDAARAAVSEGSP